MLKFKQFLKESNDDWWNSQTKEFQQSYIKAHPNSKYAVNAKKKDDISKSNMSKESGIDKLANSKNSDVRMRVAQNPNLSLDIISKLADDKDALVRDSIALNKNTPPSILAKLANNEDEESFVGETIALNKNTPPSILAKLAKEEDEGIRYNVAINVKTPSDVLAKLANDSDRSVRAAVSRNPNTPIEALNILAKDKYADVRRKAEYNISDEYFRGLHKAANRMDSSKANSLLDMNRISDPKLKSQRSLARLKWMNDTTVSGHGDIFPPKWHSALYNYNGKDAKKVYRDYLAQFTKDPNKEVANEAKRIIKYMSSYWLR